jgi:hypothetical protein
MNDQRGMAVTLVSLGDLAIEIGKMDEASKQLSEALELAQAAGDIRLVVEALVVVIVFFVKAGNTESSGKLLSFVLEHPALTQEARERAESLTGKVSRPSSHPGTLEEIVQAVIENLNQ